MSFAALIVAHGQPSEPDPAEARLARFAGRVSEALGEPVGSATIAKDGALEAALDPLPAGAPIYPLFMSNGWFVKTVLRKRLAQRDVRMLAPLGLDPGLPQIGAAMIRAAAISSDWKMAETEVLLAAHGSGVGPAAAEAARGFASALGGLLPGTEIRPAFVEEAPLLADVVQEMNDNAICLPFFAMTGEHVRDDIGDGAREAGFTGPILPPVGEAAAVPALIADAIRRSMRHADPQEQCA